jgi:hypothetical protein
MTPQGVHENGSSRPETAPIGILAVSSPAKAGDPVLQEVTSILQSNFALLTILMRIRNYAEDNICIC